MSCASSLGRPAYAPVEAREAQDGIDKAISERFDPIHVDIQLPVVDGYAPPDQSREIRSGKASIIVTTAAGHRPTDVTTFAITSAVFGRRRKSHTSSPLQIRIRNFQAVLLIGAQLTCHWQSRLRGETRW